LKVEIPAAVEDFSQELAEEKATKLLVEYIELM
jgi:hypothetical protein